ncbi:MAG: RHS repeat-associated core domain-containing protein [Cyanobacteria bacterium P01_A01_bin.83]
MLLRIVCQSSCFIEYFYLPHYWDALSYGDAGEITVTDSNGATVNFLSNSQGLFVSQLDTLKRWTQFQYDTQGNLTGINATQNFEVVYSYDEQGNLTSLIDPLENEIQFTYEPNYQKLQTVIDARKNELNYRYNEQGNLTAITYEDGSSENFTVNEQGNTVESVNRRGIAIGYEYNTLAQVTRVEYEDGTVDTYTYDDAGRLTSTNDASGTTLIEYDANNPNLIAKITYPTGRSLAYTYDEIGRRTQMVDQNGSEVNYSYDGLGRLAGLTDETGSLIISYTYDEIGRLAREDNGNSTYTTYTYDLAGQLLNLANYAADNSLNSSYVYTYDDLGRQISATELDGEWVYEYDASSQLIGAVFTSSNPEIENQDLTYVYDAAGNRIRNIDNGVTTEYKTNNLNQYTNAGTADYQYDLDGNLIYKSDGVNSWTYSYDDQNLLVSVLEANGSLTEYEYDIFGNRIATVYNGERTEYLVDPFGYGDVVGEYDGNGNLTAEYTHGIGLISRTDSSNVAAYYDFNATGSAVGLTGTGGEVLNSYGYLPYGESLFESESINNAFEFVSQWGIMEEANGLDFMRARYYLPSEGRFLNTDPIGLAGGDTNFYRYVNNNPLNLIDPSGLSGFGIQGNLGAGFGTGRNQGIYVGGDAKLGIFTEGTGAVVSGNAFDSTSNTDFITGREFGAGFSVFATSANNATEIARAGQTM